MTTFGVEEEYLVVEPHTRAATPRADAVLKRAALTLGDRVTTEITQFQVEAKTPPCTDLEQLHHEVRRMRHVLAAAAKHEGLRLAATGTAVLGDVVPPPITDKPRYHRGVETYGVLHDEQSICACHVHVAVPDRERAILVSNHLRPWLPTLVAMTANSPYWQGQDTGYASWRTLSWGRWPVAGPPPYFTSAADYANTVDHLLDAGVLVDHGTIFWDVRPSHHLPTIEVRTADVPLTARETAAHAAIVRALVTVSLDLVERGVPGPQVSPALLRAAYWLAARDGASRSGLDTTTGRLTPAGDLIAALIAWARPALLGRGELDFVTCALDRLLAEGTGAARQRQAFVRRQLLTDVVDHIIDETSS